jgi:ribonuclease J
MSVHQADPASTQPLLEVVPLGGLGEFGLNSMAVSYADTLLAVDAGSMFPEPELLGIDLIVPDFTYLFERPAKTRALVLTHGHEDHIGAVPYVVRQFSGPIYGTPMTLALVEAKLTEQGIDPGDRLVPVRPRDRVVVGEFTLEFLRVTHSMPDCVAVAIHTPVGTIVHTGDFKVDQTPLDAEHFDFHRFSELGTAGVLALFSDSTNIERPGFTGSELDVVPAFEEVFASTRGRIVVTSFATSVYRLQILVNLAAQFGRKVAFLGRGMVESSQLAQRLGYLKIPAGLVIRESEIKSHAPSGVVCLVTGSQGEPMSALSRIAINDHRHLTLAPDDVVVFSAREIPGNERSIDRVARARVGARQRRGAEAAAVARAAPVFHSHPRVVPAAGAAREGRRAADAQPAGPRGGDRRRERRRPALRPERRLDRRQGAGRPRADRRHVGDGHRRRGAARPPPPGRGRADRARARDQQADRHD